nr:PREDICTED: complement factor H [Anolis carolinensis]|eukprot:XP_016852622.1 PREDICTED: complement factor H [Anolis carolinensis]
MEDGLKHHHSLDAKKKPCGHPGDIESGSFELVEGEDFSFGARVEYRCEEGYKMLSHTNYRECRADGWSNDVPHCEITKCFPVREPKNGRILMTGIMDLDQDFPYGHLLQFECNDRFKIKGSNQIVCTSDGTWSPEVPTCVEITCEPPNIAHGRIRNSKPIYQNGERIQISCNDGYKPVDRDEATCTRDGWNTRVECIGIVCQQPQIDNGDIQPKKSLYQYQEQIETFCDEGYRKSETSFCTAKGWQPPPACTPKRCEYPHIQNGRLYYNEWEGSFPKRLGYRLVFICNNGFLPKSKDSWHSSYCTIRGWNPEPKCFKKCDHPQQIQHGAFNYRWWSTYIEGDDITLSCDTGYIPANEQTKITCGKNGWSPTPSCVAPEIPRCQNLPPPNGFFTVQKEEFSINENISYKCKSGYTTPNRIEVQEIQCLQSGWNPEPKCIKACKKPYEANVDFDENQSFFFSQETLHFQCKDGFQVNKTAVDGRIQCTENGWDSKPICVAIECDVPILGNGSIEGKEQFANGDVVKFFCDKGYNRVGPDSSQCYYFGWSPKQPVCKETVKSCQQPLSISNGTVVGDPLEEYQHGEKLFYECDIGFVMSGSNTVECVDGEWTSLPSCTEEVRSCRRPPKITSGKPVDVDSNSNNYRHNETVKYECSRGFFLVGTNPARCLHGEWKLPECSKKCRKLEITKFGPRVSKQFVNNNMVVRYNCSDYLHETRCVNGKWLPEPECTELCPPPPQLPNAISITETRNYKNGEEIGFTCMEHFHRQGPPKMTCEFGRWQTPPRCIDERCENPPSIENGEVENSSRNKYLPGETVEYHCVEGFEITGSSFATCGNAKWQRLPACKERTCGRPPLTDNASFTKNEKSSYQSGETVHYECQPGFAAKGPLILRCQRGEWSEPSTCDDVTCREPPVVANGDILVARSQVYLPGQEVRYECHEGFEISGPKTIRCENKTWSDPPTCEDVRCPPPPDILNGWLRGNKKQKYSPNETMQYQCDNGYYISGSRTITCSKKQWSTAPQCKANTEKCGRPPSIENGDIRDLLKEQYESGERVIYKCQRYYNMEGDAAVSCQNGHWSDTPKCIVPCTASQEDMERNNIRLRWTGKDKLYSTAGDVAEFSCKWGYRPDPSSPEFRVQCVNGTFEYPQCIRAQI